MSQKQILFINSLVKKFKYKGFRCAPKAFIIKIVVLSGQLSNQLLQSFISFNSI
jgi:hypothetical protein